MSPVEGDDLACITGLETWSRQPSLFPQFAYLYEIQPGSYQLLRLLHAISGMDYLLLFGGITAGGAAAFIFFSSWLLARLTELRPVWCALAVIACQEFTAAAYYANTSALAGAVTLAGIWLTTRTKSSSSLWLGGVVIGVGAYLRLDAGLIAPATLGFQLLLVSSPWTALRRTALVASFGALTLLVLLALSGTSLVAASHTLSQRGLAGEGFLLVRNMPLMLSYSYLGIGISGFLLLVIQKFWRLAALICLGVLPSLLIYGPNLTTTKYLYYAAPFLLLPGIWLLAQCVKADGRWRRTARVLFVLMISAVVIETCGGLQSSSPPFRRFDPAPLRVVFARTTLGDKKIVFGLGEGEIMPTDDGFRLRGGLLYAPEVWRREKSLIIENLSRLDRELAKPGSLRVITSTYLSRIATESWLLRHGYRPQARQGFPGNDTSWTAAWTTADRQVTLVEINHTPTDQAEFLAVAESRGPVLFLNDLGRQGFRHLAGNTGRWQRLSVGDNDLLTIYRR
ncbi:MAG: hypothetical protein ABI222_01910 [Opitutaceae bacterium]